MKCLKCREEKELYVTDDVNGRIVGFCIDCWMQVNKAGYCLYCGSAEDLFVNAMWRGRIIEHICGHCRATKG